MRLDLTEQDHDVIVEVSDTGPGPPPVLQENLFDPFVTSKPEGAGLGLALARHVAQVHHGSLSWSREGAWTRFRLCLPRAEGGAIAPRDES